MPGGGVVAAIAAIPVPDGGAAIAADFRVALAGTAPPGFAGAAFGAFCFHSFRWFSWFAYQFDPPDFDGPGSGGKP